MSTPSKVEITGDTAKVASPLIWRVESTDVPAGIRWGVTTRAMGNMKDPESRRAALEAAGLGGLPVYLLKQVHGIGILSAGDSAPAQEPPEGDGWITKKQGVVLSVFVADCLPIFLWERSGRAVGVFHAGRRGIEKGMPREAVASFLRIKINWGDLHAEVGPHIGACCYRVGPETAEKFPASAVVRKGEGVHLDLGREAGAQLRKTGVGVGISPDCTACGAERFFSFRREKTDVRMMAFACIV